MMTIIGLLTEVVFFGVFAGIVGVFLYFLTAAIQGAIAQRRIEKAYEKREQYPEW